jgi:hypothetical protein
MLGYADPKRSAIDPLERAVWIGGELTPGGQ